MSSRESALSSVTGKLWIGGAWRDAESDARFDVEDPATGETLAQVADASAADGQRALDAAVAVQDDWAATSPRERGEVLRRAFELVGQHSDELATLMTLEMGKS